MKKKSQNTFIKEKAIKIGKINGYEYWIVPAPMEGGLNGYIVFPKRPVRETGYEGILTYVPVHGGITYVQEDELGMVYGFDTLHCDSAERPRTDKAWIKKQCKIMLEGILKAKKVEHNYLRCLTNKGRGKWAQQVSDIQPKEAMNFGVNINLLCGKL